MVMSLSHEINVLCGPSDGSPLANVRDGQKSNHDEGSNRKRITYAVYTYTYMFICLVTIRRQSWVRRHHALQVIGLSSFELIFSVFISK